MLVKPSDLASKNSDSTSIVNSVSLQGEDVPCCSSLPVVVDAMGGDSGLGPVVDGAVMAARQQSVCSILVGDQVALRRELQHHKITNSKLIQIQHATQVATMEDSASSVIRKKPEASVRIAFELVKNGSGCAVVSTGNTGAVMACGITVLGMLGGIARPAIASQIPKLEGMHPTVLLDSGANVGCSAEQLVQFSLMGQLYAQSMHAIVNPRVALLSNGTELSKGTDIIRATAQILSRIKSINYIGFVEGRDLARDVADVVVCDGFVGNILLKGMEGAVELVSESFKQAAKATFRATLGMWLCKPEINKLFKHKLDPEAYGGAPLLGLNNLAIVCHGTSNSRAVFNAILMAKLLNQQKLCDKLSTKLGGLLKSVE